MEKHDYAAAEPLLKEFVAAHPDNYAAWYDLGFVYRALDRRDDSIAAYRKSVAAKPDIFESNLNLGLALANAGDAEAAQFLRAATSLKPVSNPDEGRERAWIALGRVLASSQPDQAITALQQAAAIDPKDPEPHLLAGSVLEKRDAGQAEKQYQAALALAPDSPDALTALTNFYMQQKRFADAEAVLRKLLLLHPNDAGAHFQFGRMLAISGKRDDAIGEMEAGLKLDASDTHAQRDLADMYSEAGKYDRADTLYQGLLTANPKDAVLHQELGRVFLKQKKFPEAEREFLQAVQLRPDLGPAYGDLAFAASENKNYPLVIKAADLRATFLPETPMTYFLRATAYDHLRDAKQAARYYHQFLEAAAGKFPDQEWQAKHRLIAIEPKK